MKRTLYIGDVHGCADELERIIDAFGFVRGSDTLYQTGDIINKGPDMWRAMQTVLKLGILTVRGNHEEHLIRMMETPEDTWTEKQKKRFRALKKRFAKVFFATPSNRNVKQFLGLYFHETYRKIGRMCKKDRSKA